MKTKLNKVWKLFIKVITGLSKVGLCLNRVSIRIKREAQVLLFLWKIGCLKSEAQAFVFRGESRECFIAANINSQLKRVFVFYKQCGNASSSIYLGCQ